MYSKGLDFKHKEVINIKNAQKLGLVQDVTADLNSGNITSIIVPGTSSKLFGFFKSTEEISIPWTSIKCIGEEIILVEI